MKGLLGLLVLASMLCGVSAHAQTYGVTARSNVDYVEHDGVKLTGDLYLPKTLDKAPVLIAVHGGGWQIGSPIFYRYWGPFLAKNGVAVFAIRYRLSKPGCEELSGRGLRRQSRRAVRARQCGPARRRPRSHRNGWGFRGRASGIAGGARRRRAAVLDRIP